jgi:signal peptidase I
MSPLSNLGNFLLDILQTIVLAIAIFMVAYLFLFQPHQVQGHSMDPNFQDGEYLLTDKVSYRLHEPEDGDVIVFHAPPAPQDDYIKRIIAVPGETVEIREGKVYVNNKLVNEQYIPKDFQTHPGAFLGENKPYTVSAGEYFVMGDNRDHSSDSRSWGPVKKNLIIGKAWFVYWPPSRVGFIPSASF